MLLPLGRFGLKYSRSYRTIVVTFSLKLEAGCSYETFIITCQTTGFCNPDDHKRNICRRENLNTHARNETYKHITERSRKLFLF
jgi:hypothetical protein